MSKEMHHSHKLFHLNDIVVFLVTVASGAIFLTVGWTCHPSSSMIDSRMPVIEVPQPVGPLALALDAQVELTLPEPLDLVMAPEPVAPVPLLVSELKAPIPKVPLAQDAFARHSRDIPFHGIIVQVAGRYEVDPHLIRAIIFAESGYNPKAKSKKGAQGLMQLMPTTARVLGVKNVYDPEENIDGGVRYFKSLLDRFEGNVQLALAAYNAGARHVRNYEGIPPFKATRLYIKKVLKFHQKFKTETQALAQKMA